MVRGASRTASNSKDKSKPIINEAVDNANDVPVSLNISNVKVKVSGPNRGALGVSAKPKPSRRPAQLSASPATSDGDNVDDKGLLRSETPSNETPKRGRGRPPGTKNSVKQPRGRGRPSVKTASNPAKDYGGEDLMDYIGKATAYQKLSETEQRRLCKNSQARYSVLKCIVDGCSHKCGTGNGMFYHLQTCGRARHEVTVVCEKCERTIDRRLYEKHLKDHIPDVPEMENLNEDEDSTVIPLYKPARKSAQKAMKRLALNENKDSIFEETAKNSAAKKTKNNKHVAAKDSEYVPENDEEESEIESTESDAGEPETDVAALVDKDDIYCPSDGEDFVVNDEVAPSTSSKPKRKRKTKAEASEQKKNTVEIRKLPDSNDHGNQDWTG